MSRKAIERWAGIASSSLKSTLASTVKPSVVEKPAPEVIALSPEIIAARRHQAAVQSDIKVAQRYINKSTDAERRGLSFSLTYPEFYKIVASPVCAYSGKPFAIDEKGVYAMTLERINPVLGYTPDNTIAVTSAANSEKSRLDAFVKGQEILPEMKIKLLRKALYQLEKLERIKKG